MPLPSALLAEQLWAVNGPIVNAQGIPLPATSEIKAYASGFCNMMLASICSHLPGTVTGSAAPGTPLLAGQAQGGKFVVVPGPTMGAEAGAGNPLVAPVLLLESTAIASYVMAAAIVNFAPNSISGNSTEIPPPTGPTPGPLVAGTGAPVGRIVGLTGAACTSAVNAATGGIGAGPTQPAFYDVLMTFLTVNALVSYATGTVIGVMTGGQLTAGAAAGGTVS